MFSHSYTFFIFFFNDTATTEIYTLSLHDALPIFYTRGQDSADLLIYEQSAHNVIAHNSLTHGGDGVFLWADRKSTRLNSSHVSISYAVFCLKKKKNMNL